MRREIGVNRGRDGGSRWQHVHDVRLFYPFTVMDGSFIQLDSFVHFNIVQ